MTGFGYNVSGFGSFPSREPAILIASNILLLGGGGGGKSGGGGAGAGGQLELTSFVLFEHFLAILKNEQILFYQ